LTKPWRRTRRWPTCAPGLAYIRIAHLRRLKGDLDGAVDLYRRAAGSFGPTAPEAAAWSWTQVARLELALGRRPGCDRALDTALNLVPSYPPALLARGRLHLASGEGELATTVLRQAVVAQPLPEYRWTLIEALRFAGHAEEAVQVKRRLLATGTLDDPRTMSLYLATQKLRPNLAVRLAKDDLDSRADAATLDAVVWSLFAAGRNEEAGTWSERAVATGTRGARVLLHAGVIALARTETRLAQRRLMAAQTHANTLLPSERTQLDAARAALTRLETTRSKTARAKVLEQDRKEAPMPTL
jgi:tetratricopeptide (TPR) repeat protein